MINRFRNLIKRPESANDYAARQSISTGVSVPSAFGAHDPVENNAGTAASSKYIGFITVVLSTTTWPLFYRWYCYLESGYVLS